MQAVYITVVISLLSILTTATVITLLRIEMIYRSQKSGSGVRQLSKEGLPEQEKKVESVLYLTPEREAKLMSNMIEDDLSE